MDKNKTNMNGENNKKNPIIINHYHYGNNKSKQKNNNKHHNKNNRYNRQNIENKKDIKISIPIDNSGNITGNPTIKETISPKNGSMSPRSHIIVRSTTDPNNMRIIPFNQNFNSNINPFMMQQSFLKSLFEKDPKDVQKEEINNDIKPIDEEYVEINDVNTLDDLIKLGELYDLTDNRKYPINMKKLKNIINPLKELKNVIGMESVKKNIFEQLIYILQELNDNNMMHTVIEGPPGVGKTLLGKILAKIYCKLEFLKKTQRNKEEEEINEITNQLLSVLNPN